MDFARTGIVAIDDQHQRLVDAFVRLEIFSKDKYNLAAALDALTFLRGYLAEHFAYEEGILAERRYPKVVEHIALHKKITQEIDRLWSKFVDGDDIGDQVITYMRIWIVDHINIEDAAFAKYFVAIDSSTDSEAQFQT
jgi:hemerythrin